MAHILLKTHTSRIDEHNIICSCVVKKQTMCPPCYFGSAISYMVPNALEHMMYGYTFLVLMIQRVLSKSKNEHLV